MAKLNIVDRCGFGKLVREVVKDDEKLINFIKDPKSFINPLHENGQVPDDLQINVVVDTANLTHIMLPWRTEMEATEERLGNGEYSFPSFYCDGSVDPSSDNEDEREKAYNCRVGDYVLGRCF